MHSHRGKKIGYVLVLAPLLIGALSLAVMRLWNWLLPTLFHVPSIDFLQALGLLVLSRILFGGMRGPRPWGHPGWRARWHDRWEHMSEEERGKFREGMRRRCPRHGDALPPQQPQI